MNLESRITTLEQRHRAALAALAPISLQRCDRDEAGHVVACEALVFPRNPPGVDELGPMAAHARAMERQPFTRSTCDYSECQHRETCRADGRLTGWGRHESR